MCVKLLTEHDLEFLSLKGGCTGLSESTLVKMPLCWKSHVTAHTLKTHCQILGSFRTHVHLGETTCNVKVSAAAALLQGHGHS